MNPVLYIVAFTDLPDFNAGKMAAQVAHAASQADSKLRSNRLFRAWKRQAYQFGTTIVLKATAKEANKLYTLAAANNKIRYGNIYDPTYPVRVPNRLMPLFGDTETPDETSKRKIGKRNTVMFFEYETCAWFFGNREDMPKELLRLPLR